MSSPFPCSPVIREWLWKKSQIEKKQKKKTECPVCENYLDNSIGMIIKLEISYIYVHADLSTNVSIVLVLKTGVVTLE